MIVVSVVVVTVSTTTDRQATQTRKRSFSKSHIFYHSSWCNKLIDFILDVDVEDVLAQAVPILRFKVRSTDAWRARRARAYNGVLQRGPGAEPLVRGSGGDLLAFQRPLTARKITSFTVFSKLRVCDVSSTFNRIPNISLLKTG